MSDHDDYEVGYKKPPKSGQFKPGQSGNPKGRPKGKPSAAETIDRLMRQKIRVKDGGQVIELSRFEALGRRIIDDALKGNARATDQVLKLMAIGSASSAQATPSDGTEPDHMADLEALKELFRQNDLDPSLLGDAEDGEAGCDDNAS